MKRFLFSVLLIVLVFALVSCDSNATYGKSKSYSGSDAYSKLGKVSRVFYPTSKAKMLVGIPVVQDEVPRYVSGQEISAFGFKKVVFEANLVEYESLDPVVVSYVENLLEFSAMMHQSYAGFNSASIDADKTYVEFATYRDVVDDSIIYHEIRIFYGDFMDTYQSNGWYAKSVLFSPDLTIDANRNINIYTGKHAEYRPKVSNSNSSSSNTQQNTSVLEMKETEVRKPEFEALGKINKVYAWYLGDEIDLIHMFGGDEILAECYLVELNSLSEYYVDKFSKIEKSNGLHQRGWSIESDPGKEYVEVIYYNNVVNPSGSWKSFRLRVEKMPNTTYGYYTKCTH